MELGYDPADTPVIVVSNRFHLAQVRLLCHRYGLTADTLGAPMPDPKVRPLFLWPGGPGPAKIVFV